MWCFQSTNRFPARQFSGMASARGAGAVHHLDEVAADAQSDSIGAALVHCPSVRVCSSPARVHTTRVRMHHQASQTLPTRIIPPAPNADRRREGGWAEAGRGHDGGADEHGCAYLLSLSHAASFSAKRRAHRLLHRSLCQKRRRGCASGACNARALRLTKAKQRGGSNRDRPQLHLALIQRQRQIKRVAIARQA